MRIHVTSVVVDDRRAALRFDTCGNLIPIEEHKET